MDEEQLWIKITQKQETCHYRQRHADDYPMSHVVYSFV
jgi:hypothetical protein